MPGEKGELDMPAMEEENTRRLLDMLERHGPAALKRIFEQAGAKLTPTAVRELAQRTPVMLSDLRRFKAEVLGLALACKPGEEDSVVASDEQIVSLLQIRAANTKTRAHTPAKLRDMLPAPHRARFVNAVEERIASGRWPADVGAIRAEGSVLVFLREHIQTQTHSSLPSLEAGARAPGAARSLLDQPAQPLADAFPTQFERAFGELHDPRRSNLVELAPLRARLSAYDRDAFDSGLRKLRESARYVLQTFDGRHGELPPELERAAIQEAGRTFVYVAKRDP
jgi:hypothetical protein